MTLPAPSASNGELVLIDLGLVKEFSAGTSSSGMSVTLVDGKAVGMGTPRYAAPEQFNGGAVSPATDIHALGMLANECFGGRPPHAWERIISRSTSSIPERRYADVGAFARAIRHRHSGRIIACCGVALAMIVAVAFAMFGGRDIPREKQVAEGDALTGARSTNAPRVLVTEVITNVVERPNPPKKLSTNDNKVGQNEFGTIMRLNNQEIKYEEPIILDTNRYYWVVGPGTLDASIEGLPESRLCLDDCVLINRTKKPLKQCGVHYIFRKGSYLNFINQDRSADIRSYIEDFDVAYNSLEFRGPKTKKELMKRRAEYFNHATASKGIKTDNSSNEKCEAPAAADKSNVPSAVKGEIRHRPTAAGIDSTEDSDF